MKNKVLIKRSLGLSPLLEFILFTILAALGVSAAFFEFQTGVQGEKNADFLNEIGQIAVIVLNLDSGQPSYLGVSDAKVASYGGINNQYLTPVGGPYTGILSPFGFPININVISVSGVDDEWTLEATRIPNEACIKAISTANYGPNMLGVVINGGTSELTPVDLTTSTAQCNQGANDLLWTFK